MAWVKRWVVTLFLVLVPVWGFAHGDNGPSSGHGPGMMMSPQQMEQMHRNWSRMDGMMNDIPETQSQDERQRLMREHWQAMQEQMELMHQQMMGPGMERGVQQGMMGRSGGQGMANGRADSNPGAGPRDEARFEQRMRLMEDRMNQMQLIMEQMLQHQRYQLNE